MRMGRARIDAQVTQLDAAQRSARQHALDRLLHNPLGKLSLEDRTRGALFDAADIPGVIAIDLLLALPAGEQDLFCVDDDDIVSAIDVRGVGRLVLAAQPQRDHARQPPDNKARRVDEHPLFLNLGGLGRKGFHGAGPYYWPRKVRSLWAHTP